MIQAAILAGLSLCAAPLIGADAGAEPRVFFRDQIGLNDDQIAMISRGKAVVKALPSPSPGELFVFGAVYIHATPKEYAKLALDMNWLRRSPSYLAVGKFSEPARLSDLEGFSLEPDDIKSLRYCKPGKCSVQLPVQAMQSLQHSIDWSDPSAAGKVNSRVRSMALEILRRYQAEGNQVLGSYVDTDKTFDFHHQMQTFLAAAPAVPVYLPDLTRYLLDYPKTKLSNGDSMFFWERVDFGLKPTIRLNHAMTYQSNGAKGTALVVAVKQIYASHYLQLALDLTACVPANGNLESKGFYLISLKASSQQGLTGFKGSILRRIIVNRTRTAQENLLVNIKKALEEKH